MARKKPYTLALGILDVALVILTGGFWLLVMLVRELMARS